MKTQLTLNHIHKSNHAKSSRRLENFSMSLLHLLITAHPTNRKRASSPLHFFAFPHTSKSRILGSSIRHAIFTVKANPHICERPLKTEGTLLHRPALPRLHAVLFTLSDTVLVLLARADEKGSRRVLHALLVFSGEGLGFEDYRGAVGV